MRRTPSSPKPAWASVGWWSETICSGGSFVFDPFELYSPGVVSNPNMVVFGQIGRGKSAFVKTFLWRQAVFGRRAWVVDPKGEYGDLAAAWGVRPVALRPGGAIRLNPLDPGPEHAEWRHRRRGQYGRADGRSCWPRWPRACLGRGLLPRERAALGAALAATAARARRAHGARGGRGSARRRVPTRRGRCAPGSTTSSRTAGTSPSNCVVWCTGTSAGCSTATTTAGLDLAGPLVILDLSALYTSSALGVLMACATAWLQADLARTAATAGGGERTFVVIDEAWALLSNLGVARWLQSSWKLSRAFGVCQRGGAPPGVGPALGGRVGLRAGGTGPGAAGRLGDACRLRPVAGGAGGGSELLSLSATEAELLPQLRRGVALWKVGQGSFSSSTVLGRMEHLW